MVRVDNVRLPTIVTESGWPESWDNLMDNLNIQLVGGNGAVNVVIRILKWAKAGVQKDSWKFTLWIRMGFRNFIPIIKLER